MCEVGEDAPVTGFVGVGQGGARHLAMPAHVVKLRAQSTEACLDIAHSLYK
jgi:hypothetical protein